jgi:hypothetical protein
MVTGGYPECSPWLPQAPFRTSWDSRQIAFASVAASIRLAAGGSANVELSCTDGRMDGQATSPSCTMIY